MPLRHVPGARLPGTATSEVLKVGLNISRSAAGLQETTYVVIDVTTKSFGSLIDYFERWFLRRETQK
jgi:hypothetical protein